MTLPDPVYVSRALTAFGFISQWVVMIMNGSFMAMLNTTLLGVFPTGTPIKTVWTGFWPLDFVINLLVVFFGAVNNLSDLADIGPFLMLVDLVFALVVFNMMTLIEDRRNRKTGPLRSPAFWQILWNWCGAASVLPVYSHLFLEKRLQKCPTLPTDEAYALPFTALWSIVISLPLLLPTIVGASPLQIQRAVVLWFLGPLSLGLFQSVASSLMSGSSRKKCRNPVVVTYWIVGLVSAAVHIIIALYALVQPDLSWSRIYWPNHVAVKPGKTIMTEGAMLFMQYDHVVIYFCVFYIGLYVLRSMTHIASISSSTPSQPRRYMLTLVAVVIAAGPGAGLAWLLCEKEKYHDECEAQNRQMDLLDKK
ncbi:hypothetical protein QQS21_005425 [Conoideocrella luteorostrata]|uniref:Uncharacterized protein n=1 Tax=Conoideocrella luteorostrata TaxID=1105319 RepID=A0AAJ0CSG8_9HYPO|nr:hypothetical protein QQS21_005425 [Conoideocrella luteorostrata]